MALGLGILAGLGALYGADRYKRGLLEEAQKERSQQIGELVGKPGGEYQMSEAEMFPGEQPIQGLKTEGTGLLGGKMSTPEFYGGLLQIPGMEQAGAQGLMSSTQRAQPQWKMAEVGTPDGRRQRIAYNAANPQQTMPLGGAYDPSPATQVNVGTQGPTTPGWEKVDKKFADQYASWLAGGGYTDTLKQLGQLDRAIGEMEEGRVETGPRQGLTPDAVKRFTDPKLLDVKQSVEEVVQRNLREILGAQFTEKEGERLISRAFDENLPTEVNIRRVRSLVSQIRNAAEAKREALQYFSQHGTMQGFQGAQYSSSDFSPDRIFEDKKRPPLSSFER